MNAVRKYLLGLAGTSLALTSLATGVVNCGGSTSGTGEPSEAGSGTDGTTDDGASSGGQPETSTNPDGTSQDVTTPTEASGNDAPGDASQPDSAAPDAADALPDQSAADAADGGGDSASDSAGDADAGMADAADASSPTDAAADVGDASDGATDASPDGPDASALYAFPGQVAAALCDRISACCFGAGNSEFNMAKCVPEFTTGGFRNSNLGFTFIPDGHVIFDPVKAQACLNQIAAIDCSADIYTAAVMTVLYPNCFGAMTGTLPLGATCANNIECAPEAFCDLTDAGDASATCQPLRTAGQSCGDFGADYVLGPAECSYRGSGDTHLSCNTGPSNPSAWTCVPDVEAGAACNIDLDCQSRICSFVDGGYMCETAEPVVNTYICNSLKIVDAGPG